MINTGYKVALSDGRCLTMYEDSICEFYIDHGEKKTVRSSQKRIRASSTTRITCRCRHSCNCNGRRGNNNVVINFNR